MAEHSKHRLERVKVRCDSYVPAGHAQQRECHRIGAPACVSATGLAPNRLNRYADSLPSYFVETCTTSVDQENKKISRRSRE